ncbi:S8 family serine peptidase [Actinomadura flavalba]|uniref:S8 family serine peptidase n=1 Tax=Actinomadura flavalba TaxID=1120938 RepID=UPI00146EF525|nr:S8 family serine peptidase [Actinomadura flavalba]
MQEKLWPLSRGGGVTVGVADSGADSRLPELRTSLVPGGSVRGDGSDGLTDLHDTWAPPGKGWGHGTGMAALIAANGTGSGYLGIAPDARIMPVAAADLEQHVKAVRWLADKNVKIINLSIGDPSGRDTGCSMDLQEAIDYALDKDIVVVAASGNEGDKAFPSEPGSCYGVLTVAAVDPDIRPWKGSTRQPSVDVAAPGVSMELIGKGGRIGSGSGTSSATALTSGVVALVRARHPRLSARQVVQRIIATARDIEPAGRDPKTGNGLVLPYRALTAQVSANAPNPVYDEWDRHRAEQRRLAEQRRAKPLPASESDAVIEMRTLLIAAGALAALALTIGIVVLVAKPRRRSQ